MIISYPIRDTMQISRRISECEQKKTSSRTDDTSLRVRGGVWWQMWQVVAGHLPQFRVVNQRVARVLQMWQR